jgi:hypothetical protein
VNGPSVEYVCACNRMRAKRMNVYVCVLPSSPSLSFSTTQHHSSDRGASQQLFLDFLDEPLDSPRRLQKGVYTSHTIHFNSVSGVNTSSSPRKVTIILLDVRYHKTPYWYVFDTHRHTQTRSTHALSHTHTYTHTHKHTN